ncbi:MAG: phasin family protein [Candidatus Zixiibacteriota bacterium]
MSNFFEKTFYTGIGLASLTVDAIEKIAKDIVKERELSEDEGRKLYEELKNRSQEEKNKLQNQIDNMVKKALSSTDLTTKEELDELKKKVDLLEAKLAKEKTKAKAEKATNEEEGK